MKKIFLILSILIVGSTHWINAQSTSEHYIKKTIYNRNNTLSGTFTANHFVTYYDNLGRAKQTVDIGGAPNGGDIITPIEYDVYGRVAKEYLPYVKTSNNGYFVSSAISAQSSFYSSLFPGENRPYKETTFENSPLERVKTVQNVGKDLGSKNSSVQYKVAGSSDARKISMSGDAVFVVSGNLSNVSYTIRINEDGQKIETYTDTDDKILLVREYIDVYSYADTYYVYDSKGQVCFVISPEGSKLLTSTSYSLTNDIVKKFCYYYKYDDRGRVVEKRLPGAESVTMGYDNRDRMIWSQDGKQRSAGHKLESEYDVHDRIVLQKITSGGSLVSEVARYYYDTYPSAIKQVNASVSDVVDVVNDIDSRTKGLKTHETISVVGDNGSVTKIERTFYYDYKGRTVQVVEKNHMGGISRFSTKYDFVGNTLATHESHDRGSGTTPDVLMTTMEYDNKSRLTFGYTQLDDSPPVARSLDYNDLGLLTSENDGIFSGEQKYIHSSYSYNIQGWMTSKVVSFERPSVVTSIFNLKLRYFDPVKTSNKSFTGNITEIEWQHKGMTSTQPVNTYAFTYDGLNRLKETQHYEGNILTDSNVEKNIQYDLNGNITRMKRYLNGVLSKSYTYYYKGNQLSDLVWSGVGGQYAYDLNGNCTTDGLNSLNLNYNFLNLVDEVKQGTTPKAKYAWTADGAKRRVRDTSGQNGFDYLGSLVYKYVNGVSSLESAAFAGGRIEKASNGYDVNFYVTDHLGSTRVIVDGNGNEKARYDYLPFGESLAVGATSTNRFTFSGKEKQTTGDLSYLDFGARMYDSKIGRWLTQDPHSESYLSLSQYAYCGNNPINVIDPNGMDTVYVQFGDGKYDEIGRLPGGDDIIVVNTPLPDVNVTTIVPKKENDRQANTILLPSPLMVFGTGSASGLSAGILSSPVSLLLIPLAFLPGDTPGVHDEFYYSSSGKKSGKNGKHGDGGRAKSKSDQQLNDLQNDYDNSNNKKDKKEIKNKMDNIKKDAAKKKKGEEHSRGNKR